MKLQKADAQRFVFAGKHQNMVTPQPDQQQNVGEDTIDLGGLLLAIWRGKWIIGVITALAILLGGYYAFVAATPLFRSTAVVILDTTQDKIIDLQSVVSGLSGDTSQVNSEVEVLRARSLMGKVVDRLNLVEDPEFNGSLREVSPIDAFKSQLKDQVKALLGMQDPVVVVDPEMAEKGERDAVISSLLEAVSVRNVPLSLVFQVTVTSQNPRKSSLIADTIVDLYILNQIEAKFEATEQATLWLNGRVSELQASLEEAEAKVSNFSASTELVSVDSLRALERQIKELRERISAARINRAEIEATIDNMATAQTRQDQATFADDSQLTRLLPRVDSDNAIATAFDRRFAAVQQRLELDLARADQQLTALVNSEAGLSEKIARQGDDLITLQQLTREADATGVLYDYFLARLNETSAQQEIQQADSRILSNAVMPLGAASPRKSLILATSAMLGLMLGTGLVIVNELRSNGFRTARDLEFATGYKVLGQIPSIPARSGKKVLQYLADKPSSGAAEAIRNLRTSLMLSDVHNPPKVIISTSSVPGEGKTTNSLALAQNFRGLGKNVLFIEGDIRRRALREYFDDLPNQGIVSVLRGKKSLSEAVYRPPGFGADILAGDFAPANAADLLASAEFVELVTHARGSYDTIIIDTPPVLVVPDARIIANAGDAVVFTVHWDRTSKSQVEEALRLFHNSGLRITGLALSQINPRGMRRYGYEGQYGAYSKYGSKYYAN